MNSKTGLFFFLLLVTPLLAQAPFQKKQSPGYFRINLGEWEVTAIFDGPMEINTQYLQNCPADEIKKLQEAVFQSPETALASLNTFVVNTGTRLIMVDAGTGNIMGPELGKTIENLKLAGYKPEQIDAIFITHFHDDHTGGLLDSTGMRLFPNAALYISRQGIDDLAGFQDNKLIRAGYKKELASIVEMLKPYKDAGRIKTFENNDELFPGVRAIVLPGHALGNSAYEFSSGTEKLLAWGDIVHFAAVQFFNPGASVLFDTDQAAAVKTRLELFRKISGSRCIIASAHIAFPGIGRLRDDGNGHYAWVPVHYAPVK